VELSSVRETSKWCKGVQATDRFYNPLVKVKHDSDTGNFFVAIFHAIPKLTQYLMTYSMTYPIPQIKPPFRDD